MIQIIYFTNFNDFISSGYLTLITFITTIGIAFLQMRINLKLNKRNYRYNVNLKRLTFYAERQLTLLEEFIDSLAIFLAYSHDYLDIIIDDKLITSHFSDKYYSQYTKIVSLYNRSVIYQPVEFEYIFEDSKNALDEVYKIWSTNLDKSNIDVFNSKLEEYHKIINCLASAIQQFYIY